MTLDFWLTTCNNHKKMTRFIGLAVYKEEYGMKRMILMKKQKLFSLSMIAVLSALIISGCSGGGLDRSQEVAKDKSIKKYDLVWFDYLNDSESDKAPLLKVSYMAKGKQKTETFKKYVENVEDIEQPYIKIRGDEAFIYRPPYIKYDQEPLEGVVKDKIEQKSSDDK